MNLNNTIKKTAIFLLLLLTLIANGQSKSDIESPEYTIQINKSNRNIAKIEANIILNDSTIRMAIWGHPWLKHGWATFVKKLNIKTESGQTLSYTTVDKDGWGKWNVIAPNGTKVHLSYEVHFDHKNHDWNPAGGIDSRPEVTDDAHFLVTKALFIYSPGVKNAKIKFKIPSNWEIATNWKKDKRGFYFADSWINLINNALAAGDFNKKVVTNGQMSLIFAIDKKLSKHKNRFIDLMQKQLNAFSEIYNGTPNRNYLIALRKADEDDGESFQDSFNQVLTDDRIEERYIVWANTMAHEMFHYWSSGYSTPGKSEDIAWFNEGFTEYYSGLSLMRTGVITEELYIKKAERFLSRYIVTKKMWPVDQVSLVDAGKEKHKNWLLIYGGGSTMALALDIEIRTLTKHHKSLDDVMLLLKTKYGDNKIKITTAHILEAVNEVSGQKFNEFFDKYIYGKKEVLNVEKMISKLGLNFDQFADEIYLSRKAANKQVLFDKLIGSKK
jgi:predicted metalloprotease with PDZ domain